MRSLSVVTALMVAGSFAQPAVEKRDIEWVTTVEMVYETVYAAPNEAAPTQSPEARVEQGVPDAASATAEALPSAPPVVQAAASPSPSPEPAVVDTPHVAVADSAAGGSLAATCVSAHNSLRARHGAGPLSWDQDLAASAAALAKKCEFKHNVDLGPASNYGQNIAMSSGTLGLHDKTKEAADVIKDSWYTAEAQKFSQLGLYGMANPLDIDFEAWGHFSQEVWKATTKVGCAVHDCSDGYFTVCNYDPAGNFAGEFLANVSG